MLFGRSVGQEALNLRTVCVCGQSLFSDCTRTSALIVANWAWRGLCNATAAGFCASGSGGCSLFSARIVLRAQRQLGAAAAVAAVTKQKKNKLNIEQKCVLHKLTLAVCPLGQNKTGWARESTIYIYIYCQSNVRSHNQALSRVRRHHKRRRRQ